MAKIFRSIRKTLIEEGALTKYFKYAFGEIILIVIGILLALQIDTWNGNYQERKEVEAIIGNLNDEFGHNKTNLEAKIKLLKITFKNADHLIELVGEDKSELKKHNIDSLLAISLQYEKFNPSEDVISVLLHSGRLKLLKDDTIRDLLYKWSSNQITVNDHFNDLDYNTSKVLEYLTQHYSIKDFDMYSNAKRKTGSNLPNNKYAIFQDLQFENNLENQIYYTGSYLAVLEKSQDLIDDIIKFTEKYK